MPRSPHAGETPKEALKEEPIDADVLRKVRKLIQETNSPENSARTAAWISLRDMGNLAAPGLVALYRQKNIAPEMIQSILIALSDCKDSRVGPALVEALGSSDPQTRLLAARALGDNHYQDGVLALEKVTANETEDEEVRMFAAKAGAKLGSEACLKTLETLAASLRAEVRRHAIFDLGKYGGVQRISILEKALADSDVSVREDAVEALRLVGKNEAWGPLIKAISDQNYKIRNSAMDALRQLTKQKIENDPRAWQEWWAGYDQKKDEKK
ncbi:MAG: HEAT repeat domain-containing protein [Planctomycetota bacterium]